MLQVQAAHRAARAPPPPQHSRRGSRLSTVAAKESLGCRCKSTCVPYQRVTGAQDAIVTGPAFLNRQQTNIPIGVQCLCICTALPVWHQQAACTSGPPRLAALSASYGRTSGSKAIRQSLCQSQQRVLTAHACGGGRSLGRSASPDMTS